MFGGTASNWSFSSSTASSASDVRLNFAGLIFAPASTSGCTVARCVQLSIGAIPSLSVFNASVCALVRGWSLSGSWKWAARKVISSSLNSPEVSSRSERAKYPNVRLGRSSSAVTQTTAPKRIPKAE